MVRTMIGTMSMTSADGRASEVGQLADAATGERLRTGDLHGLGIVGQAVIALDDAVVDAVREEPLTRLVDQRHTVDDKPSC